MHPIPKPPRRRRYRNSHRRPINGRASASIFRDLANWFFLMSASYAIRTLHYSPPIDTTADATLLVSGCLALRSTCQLFHIGIRSLVINRCQNIVISLMFRVLSGDVDRQDVESLHGYWFRGLNPPQTNL
ncbi:uncharacterized protein TRIREDRAFT_106584 [Trichoderma reesei QM6a]|uniref:Predicted protein n=1 Tax=Hypocrea jecorina (strain QM6a) TaxID=431241 RepID=G0RGU0_HYPJQ|nr:uncharacterized protein TRIREDRAFT_106584 [Trichoderma reesei QM6a]EGR49413.1 predicted protein [Trichoderma reesei QM6a]